MSKRHSPNLAATQAERRFEVIVTTDPDGSERLDIERLGYFPESSHPPDEELERVAKRIYQTRRERSRFFESSLFGEPVWDMLLALFTLTSRRKRLSVSDLCVAADAPATTALRYVKVLEKAGMIARSPDPHDARRWFIELTPRADSLMRNYLSAIYHKVR